ncbi:MAG: homoserine dehydrogenase [Coriobacteriales bacterium]|jgi:homoserine dehydrogenase
MRPVNIGLIGLGTVGGGLVEILRNHHDDLVKHQGVDIRLTKCSSRRIESAQRLGLEDIFVQDANDLITDPDIDIVVELVGGTGAAKEYVLSALEAGKHVVTANKALMASYGKQVFDAAERNGVSVMFGASVGGGIPIIGPLKHSLTGNRIDTVMGIINGTTNYMLTRMGEDCLSYMDALREAQHKGFAEANPSADVEGHDAAAKIAILASIAFNTRITLDDVYTEGITQITPLDLEFASEMGYSVKLLAIAQRTPKGIDVRVHPAMLPIDHPLSSVNGVFNAIYVIGDAVGETMFFGRGAGSGPAASAVIGDIIEVAKEITDGIETFRGCTCTDEYPLAPIKDLECKYYIRIPVIDQPGVFAAIANIFGDHRISIASCVQRGGDGRTTDMVVITHKAQESAVEEALSDMVETYCVISEPQMIRLVE